MIRGCDGSGLSWGRPCMHSLPSVHIHRGGWLGCGAWFLRNRINRILLCFTQRNVVDAEPGAAPAASDCGVGVFWGVEVVCEGVGLVGIPPLRGMEAEMEQCGGRCGRGSWRAWPWEKKMIARVAGSWGWSARKTERK